MFAKLRLRFWRWRLKDAMRYAAALERIQQYERDRAKYEVEECRRKVNEVHSVVMDHRANRFFRR